MALVDLKSNLNQFRSEFKPDKPYENPVEKLMN